ncbi:unnamed protein product [Moneuplotes crassus]|uniref:Uncharacterized protein n=1 Tax=Euplotes crassus TaxID=5936 RepID=A0AAD2D7T6_EUPCR|nr:unnamed protein product [Moneuplotes crassus]
MITSIVDNLLNRAFEFFVHRVCPAVMEGDRKLKQKIPYFYRAMILVPVVIWMVILKSKLIFHQLFDVSLTQENVCVTTKSWEDQVSKILLTLAYLIWAFWDKIILQNPKAVTLLTKEPTSHKQVLHDAPDQADSLKFYLSDENIPCNCRVRNPLKAHKKRSISSKLPDDYTCSKKFKEDESFCQNNSKFMGFLHESCQNYTGNSEQEDLLNKVDYSKVLSSIEKLVQMEDPYSELKLRVHQSEDYQIYMKLQTSQQMKVVNGSVMCETHYCFSIPDVEMSKSQVREILRQEQIIATHLESSSELEFVFEFEVMYPHIMKSPKTLSSQLRETLASTAWDSSSQNQKHFLKALNEIQNNLGVLVCNYVIDQFGDIITQLGVDCDQQDIVVLNFSTQTCLSNKDWPEKRLEDSTSQELKLSDSESIAEEDASVNVGEFYDTIVGHKTQFPMKAQSEKLERLCNQNISKRSAKYL